MNDTLCWSCQHAVRIRGEHECSWAWHFEPVDGWVARSTVNSVGCKSYCVKECPNYLPDKVSKVIFNPVKGITAPHKTGKRGKGSERWREARVRQIMKDGGYPDIKFMDRPEHCRDCEHFAAEKIHNKMVKGTCTFSNRNEPTTGAKWCLAFKKKDTSKGEKDGADESAPDHPRSDGAGD